MLNDIFYHTGPQLYLMLSNKAFESPPKYFDLGLENRVAYMAFQNNADVSNITYSSPFNLRVNCCIDLKFARNTCSKDIQNI